MPTVPDPLAIALDILLRERLMRVATVSPEGKPWIFTCWYAVDGRDVVFMSKVDRVHSQHIVANSMVAASVTGLATTLGDPVQQVTLSGECSTIADAGHALSLMRERYPKVPFSAGELADPSVPDFLWRVAVSHAWLFDSHNFDDPLDHKVELQWRS